MNAQNDCNQRRAHAHAPHRSHDGSAIGRGRDHGRRPRLWEAQQQEVGEGMPYTVFMSGGAPAAGMVAIQPEWGEVLPNWTVYFVVESLEAALEKVQAMGGSVQKQPMSVPTVGTFALITDPQDVYLMLIELAVA